MNLNSRYWRLAGAGALAAAVIMIGTVSARPFSREITPKVLSAVDTLRLNSVSTPRISPDGEWVIYTVRGRDMEDKDYKSVTHVWRVGIDGKRGRQMTRGEISCTSPAWFPGGKKIAFLASEKKSGRGGKDVFTQVYAMPVDGGEARPLTGHKENISAFRISPDGERLLLISRDPLTKEEKEKRERKDDAEVVDREFRFNRLWVHVPGEEESRRLTDDPYTVSDAHWSPDGRLIAFVGRRSPKVDDAYTADVYVVEVKSGTVRKLFDNPGPDTSPRWSPDGRLIAFASHDYPDTSTRLSKLHLIPAGGGESRVLLRDFDRDFGSPIWSADGGTIYWGAADRTTSRLFAVDIDRGRVEAFTPPRGRNGQWELSGESGRWVFSHTGPDGPGEIWTAGRNLENARSLTDSNPWLMEEGYQTAGMKVIRWKNSDGQWIDGVLTLPVGYREGVKYPFILHPHGGPSGVVSESFSPANQFLAGNGFMILQPNFRGSSGYGQEFVNANRRRWGIVDYDDCMTGVDYCVAQGWADPERMICYGWSYGGYMSFWIVTQTDRFRAVSPGAGLPDLYSMYSTTDIPGYLRWFFGTPWENPDLYWKHSPIRYVRNVKSPVLILHGGSDARVPPTQAVEFYQALKDLGKDVRFVRFPREGHGIGEPRHQLTRLRTYLEFFCRHVGLEPRTDRDVMR